MHLYANDNEFDDKLILSYSGNPEIFVVDIQNNSFQNFKDEELFYKSYNQFIIKNNRLIGPIKNTLTGETTFEKFEVCGITPILRRCYEILFEYFYYIDLFNM